MKTVPGLSLAAGLIAITIHSAPVAADDGIEYFLQLTTDYLLKDHRHDPYREAQHREHRERRDRGRDYHDGYGGHGRAYGPTPRGSRYDSYTSPPLRGGSSRRTRIIENPYSDRIVTGITLSGIDNDIVHIEDVVSYPGRYLLSPLDYTLSAYLPQRYINTGHYIDYISVAAKRKEYFTVTFHYD